MATIPDVRDLLSPRLLGIITNRLAERTTIAIITAIAAQKAAKVSYQSCSMWVKSCGLINPTKRCFIVIQLKIKNPHITKACIIPTIGRSLITRDCKITSLKTLQIPLGIFPTLGMFPFILTAVNLLKTVEQNSQALKDANKRKTA